MTTKSITIKGTGCKFGVPRGVPVRKAVELTSGDLPLVRDTGLRIGQPVLTGRQKSAEGVLGTKVLKARTVRESRLMGVASKQRDS
jgi:hypothetical protein